MPDPSPTSPTNPVSPISPASAGSRRAAPGFIDQELEDALDLAVDCHREAAKPEVAPRLLERAWTAADQTALGASLATCEALQNDLRARRTGSRTRTDEEEAARAALLAALDPIIKGARRKYPDGSAERRAYGIGARLSSANTHDLYLAAGYAFDQLRPGPTNTAPKDTLKGVLPAEIAALGQLTEQYRNADFAQGDAQRSAAELLAQLRAEIQATLNPLRRDLQGAADQAYPHRDPLNAAQRKAFGLQPDRSLND